MKAVIAKPQASVACRHCAIPFRPSKDEEEFCCSGCRFVFHLLHRRGLEDFYRYGETKSPVGSAVFENQELGWLAPLQKKAEEAVETGHPATLTLQVQGISCAGCVWLLEAVFAEHPGAISAEVNSSAGSIRLRWIPEQCDLLSYARDCHRFGYRFGAEGRRSAQSTRPLVRKLGLCGAFALNAMLFALPGYLGMKPGEAFASLFASIACGLATASILVGGSYFFRRALTALRHEEIHIDLPISVGLLVSYGGSVLFWLRGENAVTYFDFVSIFTFLMLLGRWLQERAIEKNRTRLLAARLSPGNVTVLRHGLESTVSAESLQAGERFWIDGGQLAPVRARLVSESAVFALNWINGEPRPRHFSRGSLIASGARNISTGRLEALALEGWTDSQLAALLALEERSPWRNHSLQVLIRSYLAAVFVIAAAGLLAWGLGAGNWILALQVFISVLVVSCPCAIGVALPLLDDVAAARLQHQGVYVRDASLWPRLRRVRQLLFDKTGTLTLENLACANPDAITALPLPVREALLRLVSDSLHPVASCLREHLLSSGISPSPVGAETPREITGQGLEWETPKGHWRLGRACWATRSPVEGGTVLSLDGVPVATFSFTEKIRPDVNEVVQEATRRGLEVAILSGDESERVRRMALALDLPPDCGHGNLSPQDKAALVRDRWPDSALMLGDGANDSLAFDAALCRGTPSVDTGLLEHKADFYLLGQSLSGLGRLLATSVAHQRGTRAVFFFALSYNGLAVSACLAGFMNPLVAAIIMPLSSLSSIGLVFLFLRPPSRPSPTLQP